MSKTISAYRGFTATQIKERAEVPDQGDMSVSGSNVLCTNITTTKIKNAMSASTNAVSLLAKNANVNVWSAFGPTVRSVTGSGFSKALVNSAPTTAYKMGDFAGYNHGAPTPGWTETGKSAAQADVWIDSGTNATVISDINIGELKHEDADGVILVAFDSGSSIVAYEEEALSGLGTNANLSATSIDTISSQQTWTLRSYIKNGAISGAGDVEGTILYRVPNVDDATVTIKIKAATTWLYSQTGNQTIPSPWSQAGSAGFNLTTGVFDIGSISASTSYDDLRIYATLIRYDNVVIGTEDIFTGSYTPGDPNITGSVYLGLENVPSNGYTCRVEFEEST